MEMGVSGFFFQAVERVELRSLFACFGFSHVSGSERRESEGLGHGSGTGTAKLCGGRGAWAVAHLSWCLWAGWGRSGIWGLGLLGEGMVD